MSIDILLSIFWQNAPKSHFGCGSDPDPAGGAYSAPSEAPYLDLMGPTSKGRGVSVVEVKKSLK